MAQDQPKAPVAVPERLPERPARQNVPKASMPDRYYMRLSGIARFWRYVVTFTLIAFAVGMTFLYSSEITAENFGLLLRNVSFSFPGEESVFTTVRYDADLTMDHSFYRNYFAVATTNELRLYDHRGNIALDENISMKDPKIETGDDYIMVYDREGKKYMIFNAITCVYSGSVEYSLYFAKMSKSGEYLICSSSPGYLSVISIYNRRFNLHRELKIDRYPLYAGLSAQADLMMFLSYSSNESGYIEGNLSFYRLGDSTELVKEYRYDSMPLGGYMTEEGTGVVLFRDSVRFYRQNGEEEQTVYFESKDPVRFSFGEEYIALSFDKSKVLAENTLSVYSVKEGGKAGEWLYKGRIEGITAEADRIFVCEAEKTTVYRMEPEADPAQPFAEETVLAVTLPEKIVTGKDGMLFFCYPNKAENIAAKLSAQKPEESTGSEESAEPKESTGPEGSASTDGTTGPAGG